ncbi:hypothetical protein V8B97DRAFT_2024201 [Scleroderma yunnanense]
MNYDNPSSEDLVLFCPPCPQPGVNILETKAHLFHWKFSKSIVMDGNFKAEHMRPRNPAEEVWLMDGRGFMVGSRKYKEYLAGTQSECSNHWAVNLANAIRKQLASTGIGGCACARHGCFISHVMVDFQKGEQQVNMDYALVHVVQHMLDLQQQLNSNPFISLPEGLHVQPSIGIWHVHGHKTECFSWYAPNFIPGVGWVDGEIMETLWSSLNIISPSARGMETPHWQDNFLKMVQMSLVLKKKIRSTQKSLATVTETFDNLNTQAPEHLWQLWSEQESKALTNWLVDLRAMDIFDPKAPTINSIEMDLISQQDEEPWGLATWIAKALKVEELQIALAIDSQQMNAMTTELEGLVALVGWFLGNDWEDEILPDCPGTTPGEGDGAKEIENLFVLPTHGNPESINPPLPSYIGIDFLQKLGLSFLAEQELSLRQGQANDCLHEADIFWRDVRHARNYNMTTWAWGQIANTDAMLQQYAKIHTCIFHFHPVRIITHGSWC